MIWICWNSNLQLIVKFVRVAKSLVIIDDFHLFESWAITEYLEDAFPAPDYPALYPAEMKARAKCRAVQALIKTDFSSIRQDMPSTSIFVPPKRPLIASAETMQDIQRLLAITETLLENLAH